MKHPHRTTKHSHFLWLSIASIRRAQESAGNAGALVLMALAELEGRTMPKHKANFYAGGDAIARLAGVSLRTARTVMDKLVEGGVVEMESGKKYTAKGKITANRYRLLNVGSGVGRTEKNHVQCETREIAHIIDNPERVIEIKGSPANGAGLKPAPGARPTSKYDGYKEGWKPTAKPAKELTAKDLGF